MPLRYIYRAGYFDDPRHVSPPQTTKEREATLTRRSPFDMRSCSVLADTAVAADARAAAPPLVEKLASFASR
jgi:hypothetical protein